MKIKSKDSIIRMAELALLCAIVVILSLTGASIKLTAIGTSVSLVLIPIAFGAIMLGPGAGALLGFVFGAITYLSGVFGLDFFTSVLFNDHPIMTAVICFGKSTAAGFLAGLAFRPFKDKKRTLGTFIASAIVPIVNTGLFILGGLTMQETLTSNFTQEGQSAVYYLIFVCAGINFIAEFALNIIAAPVLSRLTSVLMKELKKLKS